MSASTGSFPTWDGQRALEERVAGLTEQRDILLRDVAAVRAENARLVEKLATVRTLSAEKLAEVECEWQTDRLELGEWKESAQEWASDFRDVKAAHEAAEDENAELRARLVVAEAERDKFESWYLTARGIVEVLRANLAAVEALCDEAAKGSGLLSEHDVRAAARGEHDCATCQPCASVHGPCGPTECCGCYDGICCHSAARGEGDRAAETVERCGPECSEMHRFTASCVLRATNLSGEVDRG